MKSRRTGAAENRRRKAGNGLNEFNEEELQRLGERGITPYHLARFLESLRNNTDPSSLRRLFVVFDENQGEDQCYCEFV